MAAAVDGAVDLTDAATGASGISAGIEDAAMARVMLELEDSD